MTSRPSREALAAALTGALIEWKRQDQPDKPASVVEKWAPWFADRLLALLGDTR